jgi:hypothetical protein
MSSSEDIFAVFSSDIEKLSKIVENKQGKAPFYENFRNFSVFGLYDNLGIDQIVCKDFVPRGKNNAA